MSAKKKKKTYLKIYKLLLKTKKRKVLKNYLHINSDINYYFTKSMRTGDNLYLTGLFNG